MAKGDKKAITIDGLARMMQKGFSGVDQQFKVMSDQMELIKADIRDIKTTMGPLVQLMSIQNREMRGMDLRLRRVERRLGLVNN